MIRLFLPPEKLSGQEITITGEEARYLITVLRSTPGEKITILDGLGKRYTFRITSISKKEVSAEKTDEEHCLSESPLSITLAQGMTRGAKMDLIVQKTTELGVSSIVPLITERSQVRSTGKINRWRKISRSASQQSGREKVPEVTEPVGFDDFINEENTAALSSSRKGIILYEDEKERNLKGILKNLQKPSEITLLVGPEGGFSKDEVTTAIQKGFVSASLGPRILRTETAPITAISIIQYELGDIS